MAEEALKGVDTSGLKNVTGEETDPLTAPLSNGDKTVSFIPMIHIARPDLCKAVAQKVKQQKENGATLYYEYVDFDATAEELIRAY